MAKYLNTFSLLFLSLITLSTSQNCPATPHPLYYKGLDVQAHRGGKAYEPDNTLWAFAYALQIGVETLELDLHITKDNKTVVIHDHAINYEQCRDTAPLFPNDPMFPYVNKTVISLTYDQILKLDCGYKHSDVPQQNVRPGTHLPLLSEVIELVNCYNRTNVLLNPEIKYNSDAPSTTASRAVFVDQIGKVLEQYNFGSRVTIQSFDWDSIILFKRRYPNVITVALVDQTTAVYNSTWLAGINIYDPKYSGSIVKMAITTGASILSPVHGFNALNTSATNAANVTGYFPYTTKAMVDEAHSYGLKVVPWTVNDYYTIRKILNDGVDGIISNYPLRVKEVAQELGFQLYGPVPQNPRCRVF